MKKFCASCHGDSVIAREHWSHRYANGDSYTGHCQAGHRHGHGTLQQGHHLSSFACVYIGQWMNDKRHGYGVEDNILRGAFAS